MAQDVLLYPHNNTTYIRAVRTEGPAPAMAFGRQEIATGDVVWKRVRHIPPFADPAR